MAKQPYLDLSKLIHDYEACEMRYFWYRVFGRKRVTKEMFLEAIQDDSTAHFLHLRCDWFAANALPHTKCVAFWEYCEQIRIPYDREWEEVCLGSGYQHDGTYVYPRKKSEEVYAGYYRMCLTKLCELWVEDQEGVST